jgi:hypothetical protein
LSGGKQVFESAIGLCSLPYLQESVCQVIASRKREVTRPEHIPLSGRHSLGYRLLQKVELR